MCLVYFFLLIPVIITVVASFGSTELVVFPPRAISARWYLDFPNSAWMQPFLVSCYLAAVASAISTAFGIISSYALVRYDFRAKTLVEAILLSPLIIPTVIVGVSLMIFFSYSNFRASFVNLVIAHTILVFPFAMRAITASLQRMDRNIEYAAESLGASPYVTFLRVTLPNVSSGVFAALLYAFIMSFGESGASLFLVGPGVLTIPVAVFNALGYGETPLIAVVSTIQIILIILLMVVVTRILGIKASLTI
jgi:putative spermidine/putrescine transport system permease protein